MKKDKPKNTTSIVAFDVTEMPKSVKPIGCSSSINTRNCNWFAAHGKIDGKDINSPLVGIDRDKTRVFIGDTRKPDELYSLDMAHTKALRSALNKLIDD